MKTHINPNALLCLCWIAMLASACVIVPTAMPDIGPGAAATYAAQTLIVLAPAKTQAAESTARQLTRQAPPPTLTPLPTRPSATPMPTNTLQAPLFSVTPVDVTSPAGASSRPVILALANTNCRSGPDRLYPVVGYFPIDQQSQVYGMNEDQTWWYIANPDKPGEYCWVWGESTQVTGNIALLPVMVVPTLEPIFSFDANFANLLKCGSSEYLIFRITNTGTYTLVDAVVEIVNVASGKTLFGPANVTIPVMATSKTCPTGVDTILGDTRGYLAIGRSDAMKEDILLRAIIMMCKEEGADPMCLEKKVEFKL